MKRNPKTLIEVFASESKMKPTKRRDGRVRHSELVSLSRIWKRRIEDLNNGRDWAVNDQACKESRASKAEGIQECIIELNYLLQ